MSDKKILLTYFLIIILCSVGWYLRAQAVWLLDAGLFALVGAITNNLAVYMIFERVPGLYGSGVIVRQFAAFKARLKQMIMQELFSEQTLTRLLSVEENEFIDHLPWEKLAHAIDLDSLFDRLKLVVLQGRLGGTIKLIGGESWLESLRESFRERIQAYLDEKLSAQTMGPLLREHLKPEDLAGPLSTTVEQLLDQRLAELTPEHVKTIVQHMIRDHLGWLVLWGAMFGGLIGGVYGYWRSLN